MALIVEDGTGLSTAEAYISVADADTYAAAKGHTTWASQTTGTKEIALRKGADYLNVAYTYRGVPSNNTQAMQWPRLHAIDPYRDFLIEGVPVEIKNANVEMAVRSLTAALIPDSPGDTSGFLTMVSEEIGGQIRETKQYASDQGPQLPRYSFVTQMLRRLLESGGGARSERA